MKPDKLRPVVAGSLLTLAAVAQRIEPSVLVLVGVPPPLLTPMQLGLALIGLWLLWGHFKDQ